MAKKQEHKSKAFVKGNDEKAMMMIMIWNIDVRTMKTHHIVMMKVN